MFFCVESLTYVYDCVVCLGDPCNEVHGMLLVIGTKRRRVVYIFKDLFVGLLPSMVNAPVLRLWVTYCADVNFKAKSLKLRIRTFVRC